MYPDFEEKIEFIMRQEFFSYGGVDKIILQYQ